MAAFAIMTPTMTPTTGKLTTTSTTASSTTTTTSPITILDDRLGLNISSIRSNSSNSSSSSSSRRRSELNQNTAIYPPCCSAVISSTPTPTSPTQSDGHGLHVKPDGRTGGWGARGRSLWLLVLLSHVAGTRGAGAGDPRMAMTCSSVCSHGTCIYPPAGQRGSIKATITCHCYPGWGGEQCSIPCDRPCGMQGQCVFAGDRQVCLCRLGFVGRQCSQPGYDVVTLLSLARLISTGPPLLQESLFRAERGSTSTSNSNSGTSSGSSGGGSISDALLLPVPANTNPNNAASSSSSSSSSTGGNPSAAELKSKAGSGDVLGAGMDVMAATVAERRPSPPQDVVKPRPGDLLLQLSPSLHARDPKPKPGAASAAVTRRPPPAPPASPREEQQQQQQQGGRRPLLVPVVPLVENPREHVERNVEQGSSQCMQNFVCRNGGRCVTGSFGGFRCLCKQPFFGTFCENSCPTPCYNGGSCLKLRQAPAGASRGEGGGGALPLALSLSGYRYVYRCVCPLQFAGEHCQNRVNS